MSLLSFIANQETPTQRPQKSSKVIASVDDLFRMMNGHSSGHYVYRGEDDVSYKLRPKIGRYAFKDEVEFDDLEASALREFKRRTAPYITHTPNSDLEWLALAQHHGLATRLLDWSENLFVAAYFATKDYTKGTNRTLYALNVESFDFLDYDEDPFTAKRVNLFEPKLISPRISAQMGLFSVHALPISEFTHPKLERWTIREKAVIELGVALDKIGFNSATMFPGLDGVAEHINEWHLCEVV